MAQLPPKIPNMQQHNWPHFSPLPKSLPPTSFAPNSTPTTASTTNPSWVDEFLDFSAARRGSHRQSMSDSISFLEVPMLNQDKCHGVLGGGNNINASAATLVLPNNNNHHCGTFDDEHLISIFNDEFSCAVSTSNPSSPSDHNSINDNHKETKPDHQKQLRNDQLQEDQEQSQCDSGTQSAPNAAISGTSSERIVDPKRVKRILANRQSAQRSRVRKLQYITELERSVTSLQAEVSVLSPRVAFLDHQRLLLNVDNSALKQRIAALAQDKVFKDAHQEALKREIERLRQVYQLQNLKQMENNPTQEPILNAKLNSNQTDQLLNVSNVSS